jgi:hypothetical protein
MSYSNIQESNHLLPKWMPIHMQLIIKDFAARTTSESPRFRARILVFNYRQQLHWCRNVTSYFASLIRPGTQKLAINFAYFS